MKNSLTSILLHEVIATARPNELVPQEQLPAGLVALTSPGVEAGAVTLAVSSRGAPPLAGVPCGAR